MILRSFTQNSPLLPFIYPLVIVLIIFSGHQELWLHAQCSSFAWMSPLALNTCFISILTFNSLLANQIYNRSELYHSPVFLTGLIYAIFSSIASVQTGNLMVLIAQTFSLIGVYFAFSIFRQKKIAHFLFSSALFLGIATLIDQRYLTFIFLLFFLALWNRAFSIKEITLVIIGFFTPMMYWNLWIWLSQNPPGWSSFWPFQEILNLSILPKPSLTFIVALIVSLTLAVISLSHKEDRQSNKTVQSKQYLIIFLILSLLSNFIDYFMDHQLNISNVVSLAPILLLSQYWTHYRTSLLAPFVFYISMIIAIIEFFHWF
jgi:hypothetical protein